MKTFLIYLNDDELTTIKRAAKLSKKTTSAFIVERALEMAQKVIEVKTAQLENELYRRKKIQELEQIAKILDTEWVPTDEE